MLGAYLVVTGLIIRVIFALLSFAKEGCPHSPCYTQENDPSKYTAGWTVDNEKNAEWPFCCPEPLPRLVNITAM
jgi:hypothetical protein